jgi:NAD(P)H-nitrite reductase large subunit
MTDDGTRVGYEHLLLSTGSDAERLLFSGVDLDRVNVLHNLVDVSAPTAVIDGVGVMGSTI